MSTDPLGDWQTCTCDPYQEHRCSHARLVAEAERPLRALVLELGKTFLSTGGFNAAGRCVWCARGIPGHPDGGHIDGCDGSWHECKLRFEPLLARYLAVREEKKG